MKSLFKRIKGVRVSCFFLILFLLSSSTNAQIENKQKLISPAQLTLRINFNSKQFKITAPIEATIIIINSTEETIGLFDMIPERSFEFVVKDSKGKELELSKEGRRRRFPDIIFHRETIYLEPKKEIRLKVDLKNLYNFKEIGSYTVQVKRAYFLKKDVENLNSEYLEVSSLVEKIKMKK